MIRALYQRFRQLIYEFAKFAVVGITGVFVTNAAYDLLYLHLGLGPVTSTTLATVVAAIVTYLGNRYWSFRTRRRVGVVRELLVFAVLNGVGLLIQDAAVAFNYYLLGLGHNELAGFIALNTGIALATLFRFWSYRRFVWAAPPAAEREVSSAPATPPARACGGGIRPEPPSPGSAAARSRSMQRRSRSSRGTRRAAIYRPR